MIKLPRLYYPLLTVILLGMISSCGMRRVFIRTTQPALITVPQHVQHILILDRSVPQDKEKEVLGAILSLDLPGDRKNAVQEALFGLRDQLSSTDRFETIKATEMYAGSNISTAFPDPLPWEEIEGLCNKYDTDAVIALEVFSNKFLVTKGQRMVKKEVGGATIPFPQFYANGVATADVGFRMYDPEIKDIVDQHLFTQNGNWEASASNPADALNVLINKSQALKEVSYNAGYQYGTRISPIPITITRSFYDRPKKNNAMARGARLFDTRQWQEAAETWENGISTAKRKVAGRLAYNIAVAHEVLGNIDEAIKWTRTSYVEFGNKEAKEYSDLLYRRKRELEILDEQLEGE